MPLPWPIKRHICNVRILTEVAFEHDIGLHVSLAGTAVDPATLDSHDTYVSVDDELRVARNLLDRLGGHIPLGLEAGSRYHPTTFGVWGFMILCSPTVRSAIEVGLRYLALTAFASHMQVVERDNEVLVIADDSHLPADLRPFLVERDGATLMSIARDVLPPDWSFTRLEVRQPRSPHDALVRAFFGRAIDYNQPRNCAGFDRALMNRNLPQADQPMRRRFEAECQRQMAHFAGMDRIVSRVRDRLLANPDRIPTMDIVAQEMKITARTLRRHLADSGTQFEALVDHVRQDVAERLLIRTELAIADVAERLGYSECASFIRAFKRWKSVTPRQYRISALNGALDNS